MGIEKQGEKVEESYKLLLLIFIKLPKLGKL
jgi:hypothetical protein